jgi:hypothetical protein
MDRRRDIRRQVKRTPVPGIKSMEKLTGVRYGLEISGLGKRVLRRTWDRTVAGRGSHRSHGNEKGFESLL